MTYAIFTTHGGDTQWNERSGQQVKVIRALTETEADIFDIGPVYRVQFPDKVETDAFADELELMEVLK